MAGIMMTSQNNIARQGYNYPFSINNLAMWVNASSATTNVKNVSQLNFAPNSVSNGTSLTGWNDLGGGTQLVVQGSGANPTYQTNVQNGLGAVGFNVAATGTQNLFQTIGTSWPNLLSGLTIMTAWRTIAFPAAVFTLLVSDQECGMWWNGTNWSVGASGTQYGTVTLSSDTTKFHLFTMVFDGSQATNATRLVFRFDTKQQTLTFTGTIPSALGSSTYMYFGGDGKKSSQGGGSLSGGYVQGYMAESMAWNRTLTTYEIEQAELYLNTKWALGL